MFLNGSPFQPKSPAEARDLSVVAVHQEPALIGEFNGAQNIFLPRLARRSAWKLARPDQDLAEARSLCERLGLDINLGRRVKELDVAARQLIELARAIASRPEVLLLDEPNSSLSHQQTDRMLTLIRELRDAGTAVVLISHRLDEVFSIADTVTVLRDGVDVWSGPASELSPTEAIKIMVGREVTSTINRDPTVIGKQVLACRGLGRTGEFEAVDLAVHSGEILGIAGLVGAGRTELLRCLFGASRASEGSILLDGTPVRFGSSRDAARAGLAMVPEDRKRDAAFVGLTVAWNIDAVLAALSRGGERDPATAAKQLDVRTSSLRAPMRTLSGGNQQKAILARWLSATPRVLLLDEPTRGVDVGAKQEIHSLIRQFARQGLAVIVVSSEVDELISLADRIVVMTLGRIVGEVSGPEKSAETIMKYAFGGAA